MSDQPIIQNPFRPGRNLSRVGLFGGTFDPVHLGHVQVADDVKRVFGIDRMIIVPSAVPPHKMFKTISGAGDRLAMARLCFGHRKGYEVSDLELRRKGPSFTVDTLDSILKNLGADHELMMAIGTDAFFELHTWYGFGGIFERVALIVVARPEKEHDRCDLPVDPASRYLEKKIDSGYAWDAEGLCFRHRFKKNIYLFRGQPRHISSTDIRNRVKNGNDVSSLLEKDVYDYIKEKGLYA